MHTQQALEADIGYHSKRAELSLDSVNIDEIEVTGDVRVIVFSVDHGTVKPAYGYRLEYKDRSVVLSGDTTYTQNLFKHAQNADVIVHEIAAAEKKLLTRHVKLRNIMSYHTSPEHMIKVLRETKPRIAILTHVLLHVISETKVQDKLRSEYSGELHIGEGLLSITADDTIRIK